MDPSQLDEIEDELDDAVFIVSFGYEDDNLCMSAAGEIDDPEIRESIVNGLRGLADKIEETTNHGRTH